MFIDIFACVLYLAISYRVAVATGRALARVVR